ncbi:hypothetical protein WAI453_011742 [Rhynchosporium graminicola]
MGYGNERRAYLHADHRGVCKYSSRNDPNYLTVKNALVSVLSILRDRFHSSGQEVSNERQQKLDNLLGVFDAPEDDFMSADIIRMDGSVEWLVRKENYQEWIHYSNPPIYSITAKPATGKTVLSGKVIAHLRTLQKRCSFYFFRHDTKEKSSVTSLLMSMAWQMAHFEESILNICLQILNKSDHLKADYRTIWRKLFLEGIFKVRCEHVHYWVIDALDECSSEAELISLLIKTSEVSPIHVLVTSRNRFQSRQSLGISKVRIEYEAILEQDSESDISMYLYANMDALPFVNASGQDSIVRQILDKSRGCFLWVTIVVQELRNVFTSTDKQRILDEVPEDMNDLYARILTTMSKASYGKELAKAILTWTVCSSRPLNVSELLQALQLSLKVSIDGLENSIRTCCGQLVDIDSKGQVQMTHSTARQFLLDPGTDSEFRIDEKEGHCRILLTILECLNSDQTRGAKHRRSNLCGFRIETTALMNYASTSLAEHLLYATATDQEIILGLATFLRSASVLRWIEYIARHADQQRLVDVGKALGTFLRENPDQISSNSSINSTSTLISSWATDLVRLVMQFGKNLDAHPKSIYHLIPPFFPSATALRRQFGSSARSIAVRGLRAETWDDCLATVVDMLEQYSSLACSKTQFFIGCFSGKIFLYNQTTCQKIGTIDHKEPVRNLVFGEMKNMLISAGSKMIRLWDLESKTELHIFDTPQPSMALSLDDEQHLLLGALKDHRLRFWNTETGGDPEVIEWTQGLEAMTIRLYRRPTAAAFGIGCDMLAVIYKGQDILLWSIASDKFLALYSRESGAIAESLGRPYGSSGVRCLTFGKALNAHLLVCAYTDGELVIFDTSTGAVNARIVAFAHVLACSSDGLVLATADPAGTIQLLRMETLELIYIIASAEAGLQDLTFSPDSLRLLELRGSRCRIWDIADIVSKNTRQRPILTNLPINPAGPSKGSILITSIACDASGEALFVGKEDGSVYLYAIPSGLASKKIFSHAHGVSIVSLQFEAQSHTIISVDSSSRTMIHQIVYQKQSTSVSQVLFDYRVDVAVGQVVCQPGLEHVLICSAKFDMLWSTTAGGNILVITSLRQDREPYRWINHPHNRDQLILIVKHTAHIYDWRTLQRLTGESGIELQGELVPELSIRSIVPCFGGTVLATKFSEINQGHAESKLILWSVTEFTRTSTSAIPIPSYRALSDDIEVLIGTTPAISGNLDRLIFLHGSQWVCAVDIETAKTNQFVRHFFFPEDWLSPAKGLDLIVEVTSLGDVLLVKGDEIAVVRRGLHVPESLESDSESLLFESGTAPLAHRPRKI